MTDNELADRLAGLAERATVGPWEGYSEPDVNLPYSLFSGTPMQSDFGPVEPLDPLDIDLIVALRNNLPAIIAALRQSEADTAAEQRGYARGIEDAWKAAWTVEALPEHPVAGPDLSAFVYGRDCAAAAIRNLTPKEPNDG